MHMEQNYISEWLENFERQSLIRRGLVISGNIIDYSFSKEKRLLPINHIIQDSLKRLDYEYVVFYSRVGGVSGVTTQEWEEIQSLSLVMDEAEGDDYDMGDDGQTTLHGGAGQVEVSPLDFFAVTQKVMQNAKRKIAFVVDWSNYLFGQVNSLTEAERGWLQQISTGLRDAELGITAMDISKAQSLLVFVCAGLSSLPPALYLNNPLFAEITIPLPGIKEREAAILSLSHNFLLQEELKPATSTLNEFVTQTDGFTIRDLYNMARLSRQQKEALKISGLVSLYRFGKKQSPWEQLNHARLQKTTEILSHRVKGQDKAISAINKILIRAYTGLSGLQHSAKARTPKGALFFVGPTGVGKTELAKSLAEFLFGDEESCIRFDMSEFNHEHADQRLVGAPPGYVGYEEGGQLTNAIKARPFSLLLFDEIEKAHPRILDKFLQILEDGRLTDGKGETVSFSDTFIVFTSNIGASDIQRGDINEVAEKFKHAVQTHFTHELKRPELLGRIGTANILPFNFMEDPEILKAIARAKLKPLEDRLKEKWGINAFTFNDEAKALEALIRLVNPEHGGRGVLNVLTEKLFDPLADFLFENATSPDQLRHRTIYVVQARADKAIFDFDIN